MTEPFYRVLYGVVYRQLEVFAASCADFASAAEALALFSSLTATAADELATSERLEMVFYEAAAEELALAIRSFIVCCASTRLCCCCANNVCD